MKNRLSLVSGIAFSLSAFAQTASKSVAVEPMSYTPTFRVTVVSRSVQAVNYKHRGGATKIDFAGTDLMPQANGQAKVESKKGYIEIEVEFGSLDKPTAFGNEYLTYVLWAISPEGRSVNLGEIIVGDNHRSKVDVTTDLQAFALVVTAEPYFAVRQPSNVVVLENIVREDTKGTIEALHTKYELLERGGYIPTGYKFDPVILNAKLPLEFFEARNALRIAQSEGAETNAADSYKHAVQLMDRVDADATSKHTDKKAMIAVAREAVQTAEDARAISVRKIEQDRLDQERQTAANNLANTQAKADDATRQRDEATRMKEQAQSDQARAELAKHAAESDAAKARTDAMDAQAAADKAKADMADSQAASANALSAAQAEAQAASDRAQAERAASDASSASALSAAQADAEQSRLAAQRAQASAQQADADKAAMRTKLSEQLNRILQTRDSARGLIVSMSDVLFDTGKYSLKPGAREKLAKVAGILLAYPGLNIEVGGYTDNVGGDQMNQTLSENRAGAVRDYLVQQGVANNSVTVKGFGNTLPVATNDNSAGRQQNRRVELLVSGEAIGNPVNGTTGSLQ